MYMLIGACVLIRTNMVLLLLLFLEIFQVMCEDCKLQFFCKKMFVRHYY